MSTLPLTWCCLLLAAGALPSAQAQQVPDSTPSRPTAPRLPHYLRVSLGTTSTIGWEYTCARAAVEYAPMLSRHLGLAGRLVGVSGHPTAATPLYGPWIEEIPNQRYRAGFIEAEALYYPLGITHRVRLAVGLGAFTGYYQNHSISSASVVNNHVVDYELATYAGNPTGYIASLNAEVALGRQRRWLIGLKVTRQKGLGGIDNLPSQGLTLARQL